MIQTDEVFFKLIQTLGTSTYHLQRSIVINGNINRIAEENYCM
jgi:hypothetical protein